MDSPNDVVRLTGIGLVVGLFGLPVVNAQTPAAAAPAGEPVQEVTVTGSRVIANGNDSPTPVTVLSTEQLLDLKPGPVAEMISELPTLAGSRTSVSNPGTGVSNAGANVLNLRNLGFQRALVLFDGHRVPPTTYDQLVDLDMIPQLLLQRVDLVTGGASAVYGSDAISGVVNFITDTRFNGFKFNAEKGVSDRGDDNTIDLGIAAGGSLLDGRAHLEFSYQWHNDPGIPYRSARQWGRNVWAMLGDGLATPYHLVQNARFSNYTFGGLISGATGAGSVLNGQTFNQNETLSSFAHGATTGSSGFEAGGAGAFNDGSIKALLESHQIFGRGDFDFTDTVHGYLEGSTTINHGLNAAQYNQLLNTTFSGQNAFLPTAYQFTGTFKLSEFLQDMPRVDTNSHQTQYFVVAGLNGKLGTGYSWDLGLSHSEARSNTRNDNNINNQNLYAALDAVKDTSGNIVCHVTVTNPGLYPGCMPLNVFGPTTANRVAVAYITQPSQFTVVNGMDDISASLSGAPIKSWAGPVTMALSAEWRRQTYSVASTAHPTDLASCTGLAFNCTSTGANPTPLYPDATLADRPRVSETVAEGAFETEVPLLQGVPLAKSLSLNGALRFTDYNVSGTVWPWKLGLTWQMTDDWKWRAARSRDIRAPSLYELYQPTAVSFQPHPDYLVVGNPSPAIPVYTGGNPNLQPELANTTTAGFVYQPGWLPKFSFAADAYYIDITNAIISQNGWAQANQLLCYGGAANLCALQARPNGFSDKSVANTATAWYVLPINSSDFKTYGVDFELNYAATVFDHPLALRVLSTWQPHVFNTTPGSARTDTAGGSSVSLGGGPSWASPKERISLFADYKVGGFDFGLMERWRSGLLFATGTNATNPPIIYYPNLGIGPQAYTDLNLKYRFAQSDWGTTELFLNIQNVFDTQPQPIAGAAQLNNTGYYGGFPLGDDAIGRYFTVGIHFRH